MAPITSEVTTSGAPQNGTFKTGTELMYGGQGKTSNTTNLNNVTELPNERGDVNDTGIAGNEAGGVVHARVDQKLVKRNI